MKKSTIFAFILLVILTSTCSGSIDYPETDLIYNATSRDGFSIGFVNADGSANEVRETSPQYCMPVWFNGGTEIAYGNNYGDPFIPQMGAARLYIISEGGGTRRCEIEDWTDHTILDMVSAESSIALMVDGRSTLWLVDLNNCESIRSIYTFDEYGPTLPGASLTSDEEYLAYSLDSRSDDTGPTITLLNLATKEMENLGLGVRPQFSPDDRSLAFAWIDGIHIYDLNTHEVRTLLPYVWPTYSGTGSSGDFNTIQWSPDGQWIAFDICNEGDCYGMAATEYDIYIINIATGETHIVVEDGAQPYWRLK